MPIRLIYIVALIEWFSTLAVEIIAMRLAIPVVGSSIVLTSVFLGIVLLALSAGYRSGWHLASRLDERWRIRALGLALLAAGIRYVVIAFSLERGFLEYMMDTSGSYIMTLFVVAWALFFLPVFIASHTIPLLTELLDEPSKGKAAGAILFASTVWSFFGSVCTSIFLFEWFGVWLTGVLVGVVLIFTAAVVFLRHKRSWALWSMLIWLLVGVFYGTQSWWHNDVYSFDSAYQHIRVYDAVYKWDDIRVFSTNGALSSGIYLDKSKETSPFLYINEIVRLSDLTTPQDILVIGAAWFTYPQIIASRWYTTNIDAIDIDPKVKDIAETYFLEESLDPKITFIPQSARWAINDLIKQDKTYDLVFLDAYADKSVPEELMTVEFFQDIKRILADDGLFAANMIIDNAFESEFSQNAFATMIQEIGPLWWKNVTKNPDYDFDNIMVLDTQVAWYESVALNWWRAYTDNQHGAGRDSVKMLYSK